ncbi:MAG: hypothetical protein LBH69_00220 [Methanomassiliicoccaceae archaeon]|jgi:hypothetical protein|nr:hypothetical protein [Methanomassiliicoccaceae archaeon]
MTEDRLQFKGEYLVRFLVKELRRAREEALRSAMHGDGNDVFDGIYSKYEIIPLTIREDAIRRSETTGYFTDIFSRYAGVSSERTACGITEFRIPFEGDERLFGYTTHPLPFNPYGRVEDGSFIISVKEGDQSHLSDYDYNLSRLRECVGRVRDSVTVYNADLRDIITTFAGKGHASVRRKVRIGH